VASGVNAALPSSAAGIRLSLRTAQGQPLEFARASLQPIPVQINALFNPTLNYVFFLLTALIPSILQVVMVTTASYSIGLDVETRYRLRILRRLGGGLWPAMVGKILPYTILFMLVLGLSDTLLFVVFGLPLRGHSWLLIIAGLLFILSCQLLGGLLALVLKSTVSAVSIGTLVTAPAFGFMGIGFPRLGMNAFSYGWGALLPGTWYLTARVDQTVRGTPIDLSWKPVLVLLAITVALAGLVAWRLESMRAYRVETSDRSAPRSLGEAYS